MADAHILKVTRQGKNTMSKRRAMRLLLAAPRGDYTSDVDDALTQTEAVELAKRLLEDQDNSRLTLRQENAVKDIIGVSDDQTDETESGTNPPGVGGGLGEEFK